MDDRAWKRTTWLGWLLALVLLVLSAWCDPQFRTQEARVLLGAREMLGKPIEGWLVPTANGETRLNKPPLAYWTSAASYTVFGDSVFAGRLPSVLASWLTLALTYAIGQRLFGGRTGVYAAGALLGSWLFSRFASLAETDVLVMAMVTTAVYAIVRAREALSSVGQSAATQPRPGRWLYLVGVSIGLILMTKGPAAGYVLLLMIGLDLIDRRYTRVGWRGSLLVRSVTSGAIAVSLVIGVPWFVYAMSLKEASALSSDLANSMQGGLGHSRPWWFYGPELLVAVLPWTFVWMIAGVASLKVLLRWTADDSDRPGLIVLYAWGGAVLVPLLFWGNKQPHYLLPMLPATMLTTGWAIDRAMSMRWASLRPAVEGVLVGMFVAGMLVPVGILAASWKLRPGVATIDIVAAMGVVGLLAAGVAAFRWMGASRAIVTVFGVAGFFGLLKPVWAPTLRSPPPTELAAELNRRFPDAHFVFRGAPSLSLCVAMHRVIPVLTDDQLVDLAAHDDRLVCLIEVQREPEPLPRFRFLLRLEGGEEDLVVAVPEVATRLSAR